MTVSNPTTLQMPYPEHLLTALTSTAGLAYAPAPFGLIRADTRATNRANEKTTGREHAIPNHLGIHPKARTARQ